jgi:hypothetical protein
MEVRNTALATVSTQIIVTISVNTYCPRVSHRSYDKFVCAGRMWLIVLRIGESGSEERQVYHKSIVADVHHRECYSKRIRVLCRYLCDTKSV